MADGLHLAALTVEAGRLTVVRGLELRAAPGTVVLVTGPSGSGKSRLLSVLTGAQRATEGAVELDGRPVRPSSCGVVTQQHGLLGGLTAVENIATRLLARGDLGPGDGDRATALLGRLGLPPGSWHNLVEQLSGGQQQRVAVARALIGAPPLVCLDDPTSELDEDSAALVWAEVRSAAAAGSVVVAAVPDLGRAEESDQVVHLPYGRKARAA